MQGVETATRQSPFGAVTLSMRDGRLTGVRLGRRGRPSSGRRCSMEMRNWLEALDGYFAGRPPRVSVEQMETSGCTEFQQRVYRELALVPWGKVVTYGCLAERVGVPGGARAVGQAMGRNPLPIFVPCHRVVAAGRHLGGFGAGLRWKRELLSHEGWTFREDRLR